MSGSGFRGRGIEPRGICPNGLASTFRGARLSHPRFYHPRLPHGRLPTPENWSGRQNHNVPFSPWTNTKFQHSVFRGKTYFHPNGRGRGTINRGALHFPPIRPCPTDYNKNVERPRPTFVVQGQHDQDLFEQVKDESCLQQTPLLGSEEERQQKITETAVRLKEKLSNITNEDITNLWQDDLSISSSNVEGKSTLNISISNLSHEEPELNLTFNDFKDIGRIDLDSSRSDKNDSTNIVENVSNFIQNTVKEVKNSPGIEVIDLIEIEQDVHDMESMTVVNNIPKDRSQNDNGQKLQEGTNSSCNISHNSSTVSRTCNTDLLKDQNAYPAEKNQDHQLNTKCMSKSSQWLEYQKSNDRFNLANIQKSCDDVQHEQVNTIVEMQYSLHRSVSKITKKRTRWTPLPHETSSLRRKSFKSRWLHRKPNYTYNKSKNESTEFDLHTSSPHFHRDVTSSCQDMQYNTSFNLNGCLPSGKFSTIPKLMHNQDNSQSILCLNHNTSSSASTNVSSSREHILQTVPAFDSWEPSPAMSCNDKVVNIPNFNPQQPPPNFNNQKAKVPLSPVFDSHFLSQERSNLNIHAFDPSQLSAISTSPTDLYCSVTFNTTQGTTTFSTLSQLNMTPSPNFLSNVPTSFSPILTYTTPLQMTTYEIPSSATISNSEHQTLDQVSNNHNIVEVKDELKEMQEAMQFAKQAMNITDIHNIIESDQTLCSEDPLCNVSLGQENISDTSSAPLNKTINKENEKLDQHCNIHNNTKEQVITESRVSSELEREKQPNQKCYVGENALPINEQIRTKVMFNLNPMVNKIKKQGKWYQQNEGDEREKYVPCTSQPNMNLKECSHEKKKVESPPPESSWKNRIISRFLKMSKNDIRNMINNCSLRKFDIAMKHLVKEKRSSLSLEMRNIEDEKIKSYDGEEFMNQLNAMLDPSAIVDITNLPTEFIRHLSEVLQLDTIPLESSESIFSQSSNESQHNNPDVLNELCANEQEMLNNGVISNIANVEEKNDKTNAENNNHLKDHCNKITPSVTTESSNNDNCNVTLVNSGKIEESCILDSNQISPKSQFESNNTCIDHITNDNNTDTRQKNIEQGKQHSPFTTELDDIFSTIAVKAKGESKSISLDDKLKSTLQANKICEIVKPLIPTDTTSIISVISKKKTFDPTKQHEYNIKKEYISKSERYNRWSRREREGLDAFRNLTKEEWEVKYGKQTKSTSNSCEIQTNKYYNDKYKNTRYGKTFNSRRHHPSFLFKDKNYKADISKKILEKDKNIETSSSTSNSNESETDDTSTSSDNQTPSDVTKLLKVIKEKEKIAKTKSINETIRDEVTAEIQRKWSEEGRKRKYHRKDKRKKEKRLKYKKERKKKKKKVFDSSYNSDDDKNDKSGLLTETEIKKEIYSKEESNPAPEKNIICDIKTTNDECSQKQTATNVLMDKKVCLEIKDKCTIQEDDKSKLNHTIIQPKTKAQLKLIPHSSKCIEETEFMKNTAKIVLNAKCKENKIATLNNTDKPKIIEKIHRKDKNVSGVNEASECPENRLVDITETVHTVFNNNDSTNKNLINASIIKEQHDKEKTGDLAKELSSVEIQELNTKKCTDSKEASKKIDIKAYKARALQRKMENEEKIKENKLTLSSTDISKSIMEKKDKSNVALKEKCATIQISKISTDSNKFKNIKSEGKRELKLKKEKIKKKSEMKTKMKETKEMSSINQKEVNDTSNALKSLGSKVEDDQLDVNIDKNQCIQSLTQKIPIQHKKISVSDMIPSKDILKETEDERDEGIVDNTGLTTVMVDKAKCVEVLKITDTIIQAEEVSNTIEAKNLDKDEIVLTEKGNGNKVQCRTRTMSICNEFAEYEMNNCTNNDKPSTQKNISKKSDCVEPSTNLELNLINECHIKDVSQMNVEMSVNFTSAANINVVPSNEQDINLKEDITITNGTDQKLPQTLDNLEIQKLNSPESVGSPFKGFESSSCQHADTNIDNVEKDENKELESYTNDEYNWQHLKKQDTSINNNNISFKNILNDSVNTLKQTHKDIERILHEESSVKNENAAVNLNTTNLLDNGSEEEKKEEMASKILAHDCTENFQNDKKKLNKIKQPEYSMEHEKSMQLINVEVNIPCTSTEQRKMVMLDGYEDNAIMEKSDIDILKDSCFKGEQLCTKNIDSICSTDINLLDINNTITSAFSEISNEVLKNVIDPDTELSLNSQMEGNTVESNSAFKNMSNQNIINSTNIDSYEERSINNNDSYLHSNSCANFSLNSPVSTEGLWKSPAKEVPKKLQIPTKAALKESRNIFGIMDDSFSSVKETMDLKDSHFKLNVCNDQKAVDFLSDQISQKENINNKIINLEQKECSHNVHTYIPDDKDSHQSADTDSLSKTVLNNVKIIHEEILTPSNHSNNAKELESNNALHNPVVELEKIKETNKWITNTIQNTIGKNEVDEALEKLSFTETNKQEKTNNLHKIKAKQKMKHKMKDKSNTVRITNTNIKEEIMARMIEIDVEIHKLMTEKMTLYQMLESDSLLANKLASNSNLGSELNREKIIPGRLQTTSSSVSRVMHNAEHSDSMITSNRENALSEISQNQTEPKVEDINADKHKSLLQEENIKDKQMVISHSSEDGTMSEDSNTSQALLLCRNEDKVQEDGIILPEDQLKENQDTCNFTEEILNNFTENSSLESTISYFEQEEQLHISSPTEIIKPSNEDQNVKNTSDEENKQNVQSVEASKSNNSIHASLIYSDDSTWSSFAPSLEDIEQKKHNTGLALLEETYKREMAQTRKLKASARKKKKKELHKFLKSVNYLTPEEEEIPLNTLYIKKLQQKRDLLDSLDDKKENCIIDNYTNSVESEEIWKHAIEVINAVAEDRVKDLYVEKVKKNESEIVTTSSNTIKQNADTCKSEILTNFNEPLKNLSETQVTVPSLNCYKEQNSIKCSLSIIHKNVQLQLKEKEEGNENKKSNIHSTITFNNNSETNSVMVNMPSDDKISKGEISLTGQLFNTDHITDVSVTTEANKLNKNQSNHILKTNSSNEDAIVRTSTSENVKYNNKTNETNKQNPYSLKNNGIDVPKIGHEISETASNIMEKTSNVTSNSHKKSKDHTTATTNSSEVTEISDTSRKNNIHDKKISKRKNNNKSIPMRRSSRYIEDNIKHVECDDTNSNEEKDSSTISWHDSNDTSELENISSNVKRNRNSQKSQTIKDKKYPNCLENEASINDKSSITNENVVGRNLPNIDSQVSAPKLQGISVKRKIHNQSEMINCKVILIDVLKSNIYHHPVKKLHTSSTKIPVSYKSTTAEATTNSTHRVTSSKVNSSNIETQKLKDIPKSKHSCTSDKIQERASNSNQKHVTKMDNVKELKSHQKINVLHNNERLPLESNNKDISVISIKSTTSNMKTLPQKDRKSEIEILEEKIKDEKIHNTHNDEKIPSPDAIVENEQPLRTQYTVHKGPILDIKVFGDTFLAASEDGSIYRYSQTSNGILNIYKGHRSAVTCLYIHKSSGTDYSKDLVYSGSLDGTLRCYNIKTGASINNVANVGSPVQCMDQAWGIIFIGTKSGHVSRFHIKFGVIKGDNIQFSNKSVLALKATSEGPRKVLIVASRNQPITIRDAQNGLFLRTICGQKNHTVYSLMLNNNLIYCGTSSTSILVFDFTNGEQKAQYDAGVGIVCMRLYHKLLFAGCYDGNIYVFDIQDHRLICSIPGPGNMLLSMEVVDNKIIAGSKDKRLHTWQMPKQVQVVSREIT